MMLGNMGHVLMRLAAAGAAGPRPRMLRARVVITNDRLGGTSVTGLNGSSRLIEGLRATITPAVGQEVYVQAIATDHTIVAALD